jgi:VPS28 protein
MRITDMSSSTMSMDEEVRLYTTNAEREKYNLLGTLYGITVALDYLERAFVRDSITAAEYVLVLLCWHATQFFEEILASMYPPDCAVQDNVEACR